MTYNYATAWLIAIGIYAIVFGVALILDLRFEPEKEEPKKCQKK